MESNGSGAAQALRDLGEGRAVAARRVVTPRFDAVVHAPTRLQICALLGAADSVEFGTVRDELAISDSVLSKHVRVLEEAGYVTVKKATVASRQRTWLSLNRAGRTALEGHVLELRRLLAATGTMSG